MGRGQEQPLRQDPAVTLVAAFGDPPRGHRRLDGAVRLVQMAAIGEAALRCQAAHLAEALDQFPWRNGAQPEFGDSGAIYKEAVRHAVEPRGGGRLAAQAVARDVAHDRVAA